MKPYRCYFLDNQGTPLAFERFEAADDQIAVRRAFSLGISEIGSGFDLFTHDRLVHSHRLDPADEHTRLSLELAASFGQIEDENTRQGILALVRAVAEVEAVRSRGTAAIPEPHSRERQRGPRIKRRDRN